MTILLQSAFRTDLGWEAFRNDMVPVPISRRAERDRNRVRKILDKERIDRHFFQEDGGYLLRTDEHLEAMPASAKLEEVQRVEHVLQRRHLESYFRKPFVPLGYRRQPFTPMTLLPVASLASAQATQAGPSNSTAPASILTSPAKFNAPANYFNYVGKVLRLTVFGQISNVVTTPGTLTLDVRMGPTSNIIVFNGGAMQLSTTVHTTLPFVWNVLLTLQVIGGGTAAKFMGQSWSGGQMMSVSGADATTGHGFLMAPNTTPAQGTGFDSTVAMILDVFATFSVNTATTNISMTQYLLEDCTYIQP